MHYVNILSASLFLLATMLYGQPSLASSEEFDGQKFIESASVRSISEIETAKIALEKSSSPTIQAYAQRMITENTAMLDTLHTLARDSQLTMYSDQELRSKARKYVFERKGQTFDTAYVNMRALERRKTVSLFRAAINSDEILFKRYAEAALPELMHNLYIAQQLVEQTSSAPTLFASKL